MTRFRSPQDGPVGDVGATRARMHESGWFGSGPAFWRWVCTHEATPYLVAFASHGQDRTASPFLAPERLSDLARRIKADYGGKRETERAR